MQKHCQDPSTSDYIEISIIDSVSKDNLGDLLETVAELGIDSILESEELKQIPVFGSLVRVAKLSSSLRDRLFARKVLKFLREISSVSHEKRNQFVQKLSSKNNKRRAGEAILLLLDRLDDMTKPEIIGKIVRSAMLGEIDYEISIKLSSMVDRSYISDLLELPKSETDSGIDLDVAESLCSVGFLKRRIEKNLLGTHGQNNDNVTFYEFTKYGKLLSNILEKR